MDLQEISFLVPEIRARACNEGGQLVPRFGDYLDLDTIDFDPFGIVDLTNNRIKPTIAGYYFCASSVRINDVPANVYCSSQIMKNGFNVECIGTQPSTFVSSSTPSSFCCGLIYFNGSTDYIQIFVYHDAPSSLYLSSKRELNYVVIIGPF